MTSKSCLCDINTQTSWNTCCIVNMFHPIELHRRIQGRERQERTLSTLSPHFFIFMQFFLETLTKIIFWRPQLYDWRFLLWEILDLPLNCDQYYGQVANCKAFLLKITAQDWILGSPHSTLRWVILSQALRIQVMWYDSRVIARQYLPNMYIYPYRQH